MKVGVIDYGVGNLGSVCRALEQLRVEPILVDRAVDLHIADSLILPGVGSFADCMEILHQDGWYDAIQEEVQTLRKPLLGICLGMQMLADASQEGEVDGKPVSGFGFVPGVVQHLKTLACGNRVPHVGWNSITPKADDHLLRSIQAGTDFYFVHSFAFSAVNPDDVIATTDYGVNVTAAVRRGNVWGTQFHPEKSSKAGLRILRNFLEGEQC